MKNLLVALTLLALGVVQVTTRSEAKPLRAKGTVGQDVVVERRATDLRYANRQRPAARFSAPSRVGRSNRRPQVRRFVRRSPAARTARPSDTSGFQYQNFPLWAAQAFQPKGGGQ